MGWSWFLQAGIAAGQILSKGRRVPAARCQRDVIPLSLSKHIALSATFEPSKDTVFRVAAPRRLVSAPRQRLGWSGMDGRRAR